MDIEKIRSEVVKRGINTVAITNYYLREIGGSELITFEVAKIFRQAGCHVFIAAFFVSQKMRSIFSEIGVKIFDMTDGRQFYETPKSVDLLWGHHWPVVGNLLFERGCYVRYFVQGSFSQFVDLETIWMLLDDADILFFNCQSNFFSQSIGWNDSAVKKTHLFLNSLGHRWFDSAPMPEGKNSPERIVAISNNLPSEIFAAADILNSKGISLDIFSRKTKQVITTPELIDGYDAIITFGHTAQKGFARKRPVFLYGRYGGPGWVTADNFYSAECANFSGRCVDRLLAPEQICEEILDGYSHAVCYLSEFYDISKSKFSFENNIYKLLLSLPLQRKWRGFRTINYAMPRKICQAHLYWPGARRIQCELNISERINFNRRIKCTINNSDKIIDAWIAGLPSEVEFIQNGRSFFIEGVVLFSGQPARKVGVRRDDGLLFYEIYGASSPELHEKYPTVAYSNSGRFGVNVPVMEETNFLEIVAERWEDGLITIGMIELLRS